MLLSLKIVLAVVVGLALLALLASWGIRRWRRRGVGDYAVIASLVDPRYYEPARLHLQRADGDAEGLSDERFLARWDELAALGFTRLADFTARDGEPALLRAALAPDRQVSAALALGEEAVQLTLFALGEDQRLQAISDGPGCTLHEGTLRWSVERDMDAAAMLARLGEAVAGQPLRTFDAMLFREVFERAYARRQDAFLLRPPQREALAGRAFAQSPRPAEAAIEHAWRLERTQWKERQQEALLDHYRRTSRIDAVRWERIGNMLQVVHSRLQPEDIRDLLTGSDAEVALWQQLVDSGLTGTALYEALAGRLPRARQRECIGELRVPLPARIYAPREEGEASLPATPFTYEARDAEGMLVRGALLARGPAEATEQLGRQGLDEVRILDESMPIWPIDAHVLDPGVAQAFVRATRSSLPMALLDALRGNVWLWAPPLLWAAWSLYQGPPYGLGDWAAFVLLAIAVLVMLVLVLPMVLYNQLQHARLQARWGSGRLCLRLLRMLNWSGALRPGQLALEDAKLLAGSGNHAAAKALWETASRGLDEARQLSGWVELNDICGDLPAQVAAQRALLAAAPFELFRIGLAIGLLREGSGTDEAAELLAGIDPLELSELALAGYQFARGMLAAQRGQHDQALRHYAQAKQQAGQFRNMPLVLGLLAEINGFSALALKHAGDAERADDLWRTVRPLLLKHASGQRIVAAYEGARVP